MLGMRFTPKQIISKLWKAKVLLSQGKTILPENIWDTEGNWLRCDSRDEMIVR